MFTEKIQLAEFYGARAVLIVGEEANGRRSLYMDLSELDHISIYVWAVNFDDALEMRNYLSILFVFVGFNIFILFHFNSFVCIEDEKTVRISVTSSPYPAPPANRDIGINDLVIIIIYFFEILFFIFLKKTKKYFIFVFIKAGFSSRGPTNDKRIKPGLFILIL